MDSNTQVNTFDIAPPTNEPPILEMHNLNRTFGTGNSTVYALKNVNLKIKKRGICSNYRSFWGGKINSPKYPRVIRP